MTLSTQPLLRKTALASATTVNSTQPVKRQSKTQDAMLVDILKHYKENRASFIRPYGSLGVKNVTYTL